ncbi:MAG: A24 family peptidase [Gracilibacteraceae bacterium]|nr:A24 family peptidase [Gracilibacteraceae bacterium]
MGSRTVITVVKGVVFAALLIRAAATDIKRREIDDWLCASILALSLAGPGGSLWGAALTALPFFIPALVKPGSIGGGDIKLMFACGAVLGVWGGLLQAALALSLIALFALITSLKKGFSAGKIALPLAPFFCTGGIASYIITNMGGF